MGTLDVDDHDSDNIDEAGSQGEIPDTNNHNDIGHVHDATSEASMTHVEGDSVGYSDACKPDLIRARNSNPLWELGKRCLDMIDEHYVDQKFVREAFKASVESYVRYDGASFEVLIALYVKIRAKRPRPWATGMAMMAENIPADPRLRLSDDKLPMADLKAKVAVKTLADTPSTAGSSKVFVSSWSLYQFSQTTEASVVSGGSYFNLSRSSQVTRASTVSSRSHFSLNRSSQATTASTISTNSAIMSKYAAPPDSMELWDADVKMTSKNGQLFHVAAGLDTGASVDCVSEHTCHAMGVGKSDKMRLRWKDPRTVSLATGQTFELKHIV